MSLIKLEEKATDQETFDFIVGKLREQGRPSYGKPEGQNTLGNGPPRDWSNSFCLYLSPDGCKCAVGWLAPDGQTLQEGVGPIDVLVDGRSDQAPTVERPRNMPLLLELQKAHDKAASEMKLKTPDLNWPLACAESCAQVALQFSLSPRAAVDWADSVK